MESSRLQFIRQQAINTLELTKGFTPEQREGFSNELKTAEELASYVLELTNIEPGAVWVKAKERLPEKGGKENSVIVRGVFKEAGYNEWPFVAYGFRNFHPEKQEMYFELGSKSYLTNDVEWLDESAAGREDDKLHFDNWHRWLSDNGYTYDGEYYYDEDNNYFTPDQLWVKFK